MLKLVHSIQGRWEFGEKEIGCEKNGDGKNWRSGPKQHENICQILGKKNRLENLADFQKSNDVNNVKSVISETF